MTKASTQPVNRKGRSKLDNEIDRRLARRERREAKIARVKARRDRAYAKADRRYEKGLGKTPEKLAKDDEKLGDFLVRQYHWLTRRHGKTIVRPDGEIKVVLRAVELDMPADESPVVKLLLNRPGGKEYLIPTYKVNRRKLLQEASSELWAALRPLGVWRGRHRTISVKSPSSTGPKVLSRRRHNARSRS